MPCFAVPPEGREQNGIESKLIVAKRLLTHIAERYDTDCQTPRKKCAPQLVTHRNFIPDASAFGAKRRMPDFPLIEGRLRRETESNLFLAAACTSPKIPLAGRVSSGKAARNEDRCNSRRIGKRAKPARFAAICFATIIAQIHLGVKRAFSPFFARGRKTEPRRRKFFENFQKSCPDFAVSGHIPIEPAQTSQRRY